MCMYHVTHIGLQDLSNILIFIFKNLYAYICLNIHNANWGDKIYKNKIKCGDKKKFNE